MGCDLDGRRDGYLTTVGKRPSFTIIVRQPGRTVLDIGQRLFVSRRRSPDIMQP